MNFWLFAFVLSVIVFLLLVDWHVFKSNAWAGLICMIYQLSIHIVAYKLNYWSYLKVGEGLPNVVVFSNFINLFFIGIAFNMGILFVQFLPKNYFLQLMHACAWTFFFRLLYHIAEQNDMIHFTYWKAWMYFYIIPVNMITLAWINNTIRERT